MLSQTSHSWTLSGKPAGRFRWLAFLLLLVAMLAVCTPVHADETDPVPDMAADASALGIIGSGLSFAIGTLGILSIMTLLVRSRRLDIGLRRVAGATRRRLMLQFLEEAAFMSTAGGVLGVLAALGLVGLVVASGTLPGCFSATITLGVLLLSILCGVLAGTYPAWKAANTDVLKTLREL